jgi:hypothetical protein
MAIQLVSHDTLIEFQSSTKKARRKANRERLEMPFPFLRDKLAGIFME